MLAIGIDLSGPTNSADTCLVCLAATGAGLTFHSAHAGLDDAQIADLAGALSARAALVVGLDAPLSYNPGGGDRPADRELRRLAVRHGMRPGSVMVPTLTRMAYLTLRGMGVARALEFLGRDRRLAIVEVHPGAALVVREAVLPDVLALKQDAQARQRVLAWLRSRYIADLPTFVAPSDHLIMACASAIAAYDWQIGAARWVCAADPPLHPYAVAC